MTGQTRKQSFVEATANVVVGVGVSYTSGLLILWAHGFQVSLGLNAELTLWFTAVSLVRQFTLRRIFNKLAFKRQEAPTTWVNIARDGRPIQ